VSHHLLYFQADKESMRSLGSHPGYDVTFTLLNPEPQVLSVDWDIKSAIQGTYVITQPLYHRSAASCMLLRIYLFYVNVQ